MSARGHLLGLEELLLSLFTNHFRDFFAGSYKYYFLSLSALSNTFKTQKDVHVIGKQHRPRLDIHSDPDLYILPFSTDKLPAGLHIGLQTRIY